MIILERQLEFYPRMPSMPPKPQVCRSRRSDSLFENEEILTCERRNTDRLLRNNESWSQRDFINVLLACIDEYYE